MSIWIPDFKKKDSPIYKALAKSIQKAIEASELKPGDQLLPHRQMAEKLGVTIGTVARGYNLASSWGFVTSKVGQGTIVRNPQEDNKNIPLHLNGSYFDLGILQPAPVTDPELKSAAYEETLKVVSNNWKNQAFVGYPPEFGYTHHREAGARWLLRRGLQVSQDEVLLTLGTQEAFHLLLSVYTRMGDTILVEEYTNFALKNLGNYLGLNMAGVAMDEQGIVPESLEEAARRTKAQILFLTPTYHSPTTATMSSGRRKKIVEISRRHNLFIIENDPYAEFIDNAPRPIAFYAPERTAYATTLSLLGPAEIRVGYLKIPLKNFPELQAAKRALSIASPLITAEIATHWINTGILEQLSRWQIGEVLARAQSAARILKGYDYRYSLNGQFLWLLLPEPWRATDFANAAKDRNVMVIEADRFAIGRDLALHAVRISLTSARNKDLMEKGLRIIVDLTKNLAKKSPL